MDALLTVTLDLLDVLFGAMLWDLARYLIGRVVVPAALLALGVAVLAGLGWSLLG